MKRHFTLLVILGVLIAASACQRPGKSLENKSDSSKIAAADTMYDPVISDEIVFVVIGKDIDFKQLDTKAIVKELRAAKYLEVKPSTKQDLSDPAQAIIKVYKVEDITCNYLKKHFSDHAPGDIVYEYDDKLLVKTANGIVKIYSGHPLTEK
jgi:hypothetical protein